VYSFFRRDPVNGKLFSGYSGMSRQPIFQ